VRFINLIVVKKIFVVLVVSEPESPAACVDALAYIPITPHYYRKWLIFPSLPIITENGLYSHHTPLLPKNQIYFSLTEYIYKIFVVISVGRNGN
jgi:hypothetical protein